MLFGAKKSLAGGAIIVSFRDFRPVSRMYFGVGAVDVRCSRIHFVSYKERMRTSGSLVFPPAPCGAATAAFASRAAVVARSYPSVCHV